MLSRHVTAAAAVVVLTSCPNVDPPPLHGHVPVSDAPQSTEQTDDDMDDQRFVGRVNRRLVVRYMSDADYVVLGRAICTSLSSGSTWADAQAGLIINNGFAPVDAETFMVMSVGSFCYAEHGDKEP